MDARQSNLALTVGQSDEPGLFPRLEALRAAERLGAAVRTNYALPVGNLTIDATMGVALDLGDTALEEMMAVADEALYAAKADARGSVHLGRCEPASVPRVRHLPHK